MLNEMPELRAPEKSRTGMEIKPKVRYPDQTEAAIGSPAKIQFDCNRVLAPDTQPAGSSLDQRAHFDALELCMSPN
jgi:hypothetical protein